jgi:hypothetical protein
MYQATSLGTDVIAEVDRKKAAHNKKHSKSTPAARSKNPFTLPFEIERRLVFWAGELSRTKMLLQRNLRKLAVKKRHSVPVEDLLTVSDEHYAVVSRANSPPQIIDDESEVAITSNAPNLALGDQDHDSQSNEPITPPSAPAASTLLGKDGPSPSLPLLPASSTSPWTPPVPSSVLCWLLSLPIPNHVPIPVEDPSLTIQPNAAREKEVTADRNCTCSECRLLESAEAERRTEEKEFESEMGRLTATWEERLGK